MKELDTPKKGETTTINLQNPNHGETTTSHDHTIFFEDIDSACSTPYVSAPSSPGRAPPINGGFFYSAPTSPMHFLLSTSNLTPTSSTPPENSLEEFDFSASWYSTNRPMSSADELFLNGQIRPMKLSTHLQRPQKLAPLLYVEENKSEEEYSDDNEEKLVRGRDIKMRNRSLRRRTRSMSPLRNTWHEKNDADDPPIQMNEEKIENSEAATASDETAPPSGSSSRSSSIGRNSKRWVSLKEFLYRSKSEGRNNGRHKYFWSSLSFSPNIKDKKMVAISSDSVTSKEKETPAKMESMEREKAKKGVKEQRSKKAENGINGKRRVALSAHELHYTANRAQAEEMRKKTFLPYKQGLLGCLGFSSKSTYGAMNGFARALNPVSSR